jgi:integrase
VIRAAPMAAGDHARAGGALDPLEQVTLSRLAIEALQRHQVRQNVRQLIAGPRWEHNDLVFANAVGRPINVANLRLRSFLPLLRRAGLPTIRFHDLRHTAATLLLSKGVHPKIVSEMLGHADIGITLDLYSHVTPTMHAQAATAFDELLGEPVAVNLAVKSPS